MSKSQSSNNKKAKPFELGGIRSAKLTVFLVAVVLALAGLLIKVYSIQNENQDAYNKKVLSQRQSEYVSKTIPSRRGDIYDRNGNRLATSEKVYILILDPAQMTQAEGVNADGTKTRNVIAPTIEAVSEYFGTDASELRKIIEGNPTSSYVRFLKDVSYDDRQGFLDYQAEKNADYQASADASEKKKKISGVWFEDNYKRSYPYGSLGCNVIGFASSDGTSGTGGVEQYYNDTLCGLNGREYGYLNDDANLEKVIKSAENGNTLILTIDSGIQGIVEKYLKEWKNGEPGSKSAACIVMNPNNGEVLAMASTNSFDLNNPATSGDYTEDELYSMGLMPAVSDYKSKHPDEITPSKAQIADYYTRDEIIAFGKSNAMYKIWRNICVSDTYEPGSTQKIFTVAGAMEEGIISPHDEFNCEGHIQLTDGVNTWKINCVNRNGHGVLDVTEGIKKSCNVVMMNIAFMEKAETFVKYEKIFGFGEYTGIDLPAEADTSSLSFSDESIGRTQLATNSFGQNYNCTMIQMAAAYASVINGGNYYQPHVVKQILNSDGTLIRETGSTLVRETVSEATCNYLKNALFETVESGTGSAAAVKGYTVGGKTGTAQKLPRSARTYVVSFCGFAPVDDPALLCYVIVDEPALPGEEAAHSSFASGIFSKIMAEALPQVGIYPEGTLAADYRAPEADIPVEGTENVTDEYIEGDAEDGEIPDILTGRTDL
ncbi:MAG: penicillin-binding protein 2 [Lachnospiraceae bacterium]|nr:penicillin-binding protein 2 [Lachnospiraceae bacterium]